MNNETASERLARLSKVTYTGCIEFTGKLDSNGYGRVMVDRNRHLVHRLSYQIHKGPIPDGMVVMHSCDNRGCINPEHLSVGTQRDNMQDKMTKGRQSRGARLRKSSLTDLDIMAIRSSLSSTSELSDRYSVSRVTIRNIQRRKTWQHVE
ncbi:hypothetical protein Ro103_43 [Escherichia phage vB_EcoP-Ro103C3lw]|nr:hypothetical protein Ro103_43 [Escherichia phage vB_EcoP-Ro103C3lw]